jgi:Arc/MetJ-type ribon-helix-helix transcriptional regulator
VRSGSFVSRSELIRAALLHYLREAEEEAEKLGELLGRHKGEESK